MNLTRIAITRPVTILMVIGALVVAGLISFSRLPVRRLPNVDFPFVRATIAYPGASPTDIQRLVVAPMEQALSNVTGVTDMTAIAAPGRGTVSLQFQSGTNTSIASVDVSQALARSGRAFPPGALPPVVTAANPSALPLMNIAMSGTLTQAQLYSLATNLVAPTLDQVSGVASVNVVGGRQTQVNVRVRPTAMQEYRVSLAQITAALSSGNRSVPAGSLVQNGTTYLARTSGRFQSTAQIGDVVVAKRPGGDVYLRDVASVHLGFAQQGSVAQLGGHPAVGLVLTAQSTANSLAVNNAVHAALARVQPSLPPGTHFAVVGNITRFTRASLHDVLFDLVLAVLITGAVLMLFLHRVQNTVIVLLAIPTSLVMTFTVMYALHFSLDLISLMALSLLIGILVDDAIVVLENIHRHISLGEAVREAAYRGRMEIGAAAVAITLTDVVVYGPTAFVTGNVGQLFREFGLTITAATLISLLISFTLTPMLASRWLRPAPAGAGGQGAAEEGSGGGHGPAPAAPAPAPGPTDPAAAVRPGVWHRFVAAWERAYAGLVERYGQLLSIALRHRGWVLLVGAGALAFSLAAVPLGLVGTTFTPKEDIGTFTVQLRFPPSVTLATSQADVHALAAGIGRLPGVTEVYDSAGFGGGLGTGVGVGQITVDLRPKGQRPNLFTYYQPRVLALARRFPGMQAHVAVQNPLVIAGGRALQIQLTGPSLTTLQATATSVEQALRRLPGVFNVSSNALKPSPQLSLSISRQEASYLGVSPTAVGAAVAASVGGKVATYLQPAGNVPQVPIFVQVQGGSSLSDQQLGNLPVPTPHGLIPLSQLIHIRHTVAPAQLLFVNRQLTVSVLASVASNDLGKVALEAAVMMHGIHLPAGYAYTFGGQVSQQRSAFTPLLQAFGLSVLLMYMLMAALYESLLYPLILLLTLPLATFGAMAGLALTGQTLNIFSFIGLIMMVGLVAKNAILLIDYTNTLRARGVELYAALLEAGRVRLRPILMTTATMVGSMLPLALSNGAGSEDRQPMAIVVIGGVLTSTLLTLVVVPVMYSLFTEFTAWLGGRAAGRPRPAALPLGDGAGTGAGFP